MNVHACQSGLVGRLRTSVRILNGARNDGKLVPGECGVGRVREDDAPECILLWVRVCLFIPGAKCNHEHYRANEGHVSRG